MSADWVAGIGVLGNHHTVYMGTRGEEKKIGESLTLGGSVKHEERGRRGNNRDSRKNKNGGEKCGGIRLSLQKKKARYRIYKKKWNS